MIKHIDIHQSFIESYVCSEKRILPQSENTIEKYLVDRHYYKKYNTSTLILHTIIIIDMCIIFNIIVPFKTYILSTVLIRFSKCYTYLYFTTTLFYFIY